MFPETFLVFKDFYLANKKKNDTTDIRPLLKIENMNMQLPCQPISGS